MKDINDIIRNSIKDVMLKPYTLIERNVELKVVSQVSLIGFEIENAQVTRSFFISYNRKTSYNVNHLLRSVEQSYKHKTV